MFLELILTQILYSMTYLLLGLVSGVDTQGRQVSGNSSSARLSDERMHSGDLWKEGGSHHQDMTVCTVKVIAFQPT